MSEFKLKNVQSIITNSHTVTGCCTIVYQPALKRKVKTALHHGAD